MNFESEATSDSRPRTDPYLGDSRTPHSTPLDIALARIADLDLNPLCEGKDHATRLLREDMQKIVRTLAAATAANLRETIAAQNVAIDRLRERVEAGGKLAAILAQIDHQFGVCECGLGSCSICGPESVWAAARGALAMWEEGRRG